MTEAVTLPNGDRYYIVDGHRYPSVTTALSVIRMPELERWRGSVGNYEADRIRDEATELGTELHDMIYGYNLAVVAGEIPNTYRDPMVEAYDEWFRQAVDHIVDAERTVVNAKREYAGTVDLLAMLKGDRLPSVIDLKSSKRFDQKMPLQTAAYAGALEESESVKVQRRLILRLGKDAEAGKWWVREYREQSRDFNHFLYALSLFNYMEMGEGACQLRH